MDLLNQWGRGRGSPQYDIAAFRKLGVGASGQSDSVHANILRCSNRSKNIRRSAGSGNRNQNIARSTQPANLPGEDVLKAIIVSNRCEDGAIGRQRDAGDRITIVIQARYELPGNMLCVGGAAPVPSKEHLAACAEAAGGERADCDDRFEELTIGEGGADNVPRRRQMPYYSVQRFVAQASAPRCVKNIGLGFPPAPSKAAMSEYLFSGSVIKVIKPPPPAPETLPASAPWALPNS